MMPFAPAARRGFRRPPWPKILPNFLPALSAVLRRASNSHAISVSLELALPCRDGIYAVNDKERPVTEEFWLTELGGQGTLYEEFPAVRRRPGVQSRKLDGVVVLGDPDQAVIRHKERLLDGQDIVIIQTKVKRLNPPLFGQALLSQHLIELSWTPHSVRSVLLCTEDDPEMRAVTDQFPDLEVYIRPGETGGFSLGRLPAEQISEQVRKFIGAYGTFVASAPLTGRFAIEGILVPDLIDPSGKPIHEIVPGRHVTTVHSERRNGKPANLGMYLSGEVIAAQKLVMRMGAASVDSLIIGRQDDLAVGQALRKYARYSYLEL
jgi:hypothetical protein